MNQSNYPVQAINSSQDFKRVILIVLLHNDLIIFFTWKLSNMSKMGYLG